MASVSDEEVSTRKYEYLDHTADVQLHASNYKPLTRTQITLSSRKNNFKLFRKLQDLGGDDLKEAFEQVAVAMFGYMTELETVEIDRQDEITAQGDDLPSLLFHFLDEFLFLFCCDPFFIIKEVEILEFDKENFTIKAVGRGETFDLSKHPQGTEVKAITYSNMQIYDEDERHEVFVIIDI